MQKVAAYLLERRGLGSVTERQDVALLVKTHVAKWLQSKGGDPLAPSGSFAPEDGSTGIYRVLDAADGGKSWWMLELHEDTQKGRRFSVAVSITNSADRVAVYVALETGWTTTQIMPVDVDPRCPRIVRDLLALSGPWHHGSSLLEERQSIKGFDHGELLAAEIEAAVRTVPILVISTQNGYCALPNLDVKLGHDLVGLANVVVVDEEASWALRYTLGPQWGCYRGAVRLFWPHFSQTDDRYLHPLWTAGRLVSASQDATQTRDRFRKQLRTLLFRTSALSVVRPPEIDAIRDASSRTALHELKERAHSLGEYNEYADLYAADNEELRHERDGLRSRVEQLAADVARLENDRQALLGHLRAAKAKATHGMAPEDIAPDAEDEDDAPKAPEPGEIRFYKKTHSKPGYDVVVPAGDCGHTAWQGAHAADKARKGIARLEQREDWKSLQHCASCTGGGMWRVRW
jgi:hypothetical protein